MLTSEDPQSNVQNELGAKATSIRIISHNSIPTKTFTSYSYNIFS